MVSEEVILLEVGSYSFFEDEVAEEAAVKLVAASAMAAAVYLF